MVDRFFSVVGTPVEPDCPDLTHELSYVLREGLPITKSELFRLLPAGLIPDDGDTHHRVDLITGQTFDKMHNGKINGRENRVHGSRAIYDNMIKDGRKNPVNLIRSAWAGSQKYGNVIWSGDVPSTFESLRDQLQCGINMGLAGIPWWTTDIGGFMTDDVNDPKFRQLLIRWFEFAVFTAVLRMHGDRGPYDIPPLDNRDWGGGYLKTGHANELWSYGEENFRIMKKFLDLRLSMHDYIASLYKEAEENGSPLLRAMFYEFPDDEKCWNLYDQYMFGSQYLVAPILFEDTYERDVYLPEGTWLDTRANEQIEGGRVIHTHVPLDEIAVYQKI